MFNVDSKMFNVKMNQFYKAFSNPKKEKLETVHIKGSLDSLLAAGGSKNLRGTFIFSKKATKIDAILTVDLTLCSKCQINSEDFVNFVAFLENTNFMCKKLSHHFLLHFPIGVGSTTQSIRVCFLSS